jgi:hypothetical protein
MDVFKAIVQSNTPHALASLSTAAPPLIYAYIPNSSASASHTQCVHVEVRDVESNAFALTRDFENRTTGRKAASVETKDHRNGGGCR